MKSNHHETSQRFLGKKIIVTGAARGIGRRVAELFSFEGARVIGLDRLRNQSEPCFKLIEINLTNFKEVEKISTDLKKELTGLDILINVAGSLSLGNIEDLTVQTWQSCFDINVSASFYLMKQWLPIFKQQRQGSIINVASNAAHVPRIKMAAYCASKAALVSLSHCAALELAAYGVRCNVVSPGSTRTPMLESMFKHPNEMEQLIDGFAQDYKVGIPLRKLATPDDIAQVILFLASEDAGHITMQDIVVDGGATLAA